MARYSRIARTTTKGEERMLSVSYPSIPYSVDDFYVITTGGDRFDLLANEYYQNSSYWWVIAVANPHISRKNFVLDQGLQVRIPANIQTIIANYEKVNAQNSL